MLPTRRLLVCMSMLVVGCGSTESSASSDGGARAGGAPSGGAMSTGGTSSSSGGSGTSSRGSSASSRGSSASSGGSSASSGGSSASSGDGTSASGGRSGTGTAGAGGGGSCPPECFVANECVTACGQTPTSYGCCPCPAGMLDARSCPAVTDAGTVSCDPRRILCKRVAPVCATGEVPSVSGQCYGPCVKVETCPCTGPEECPQPDQYTCHMSAQHCGPFVE